MTHFRLRYEQVGGHVHCRLFAGKKRELTHAKCGDLTFTEQDFADLRLLVGQPDFEFVMEDVK